MGVYRRRICETCLAAVLIPLSGCLGRLDRVGSNDVDPPETVTEFEFEDGRHEDAQGDPVIEVNVEGTRATVAGTLLVGSGSCNEAALDEITHDTDSDTITVVVTWVDTSDEDEVCLRFDSLPSAITATERDYPDEEHTATEEIDAD